MLVFENFDLSALRAGFFGAAPMSVAIQKRVRDVLDCPVVQGNGLTETALFANSDFAEEGRARVGSIGPAAPDTEEKVVDLETGSKEMPSGEIGELLIRGPQVMKGYYNNSQATRESITECGWLRTGDIVCMDPDGYVWVLDRKNELIKYKGFQVPPAELEGLLLEHPGVVDAAVIGKISTGVGEIPKAFVVRSQNTMVSGEDLMGFVAEKVATFKRIREVEFVDSIPKTPSGKILWRTLVEEERGRKNG